MHVLVTQRQLVEISRVLADGAAEPIFLARQHVGQVAEGAGTVRQVELPARGMRHVARIPQPIAALDQRGTAMDMTQRPVFVEPADVADLPEHGIDDGDLRSHQFRR